MHRGLKVNAGTKIILSNKLLVIPIILVIKLLVIP